MLHFLHFLHLNASEPGAESVKSAPCFLKPVYISPEPLIFQDVPSNIQEEPANFRQKALQKQSKPWTPHKVPPNFQCQVHEVHQVQPVFVKCMRARDDCSFFPDFFAVSLFLLIFAQ